MATLEKIRSHSKVLFAFIAIALLSFVVGDALTNSSNIFFGSRNQIGKVEGNELSAETFQKQISVLTDVYKSSGQTQISEGDIRDAAWNEFVQSSVLKSETDKLGLSVTALELKEATLGENVHPILRQIPAFQNENRQFDRNKLLNLLARMDNEGEENLKNYWMFWEGQISNSILLEKYTALASNAMAAPKAEVAFLNTLNSKGAKLLIASKPYRELNDSLFTPSKAALDKKYAENKERYKTKGYRVVKTIVFDVVPSKADSEQIAVKVTNAADYLKIVKDDELQYYVSQESDTEFPFNGAYRTANDIEYSFRDFAFSAKKESVSPVILDGGYSKTAKVLSDIELRSESVKINAILVGGTSLEGARATTDSLIGVLKAGADFATVSSKHSMHPQLRQNGGDWGWIREGQFGLDTFDNAVFKTKVGDYAKIETNQGIYLIKVTDKTAPVKKVRLAVISNRIVSGGQTFAAAYEKANSFIAKNNTKEKFLNAADAENLIVRDLGPLTENQSRSYVENVRPIVRWAFNSKLNEVCKKPFDSNDKFLVCFVSEIVEEGYIPASSDNVSAQIESMARQDMKADQLMAELANVTDLVSVSSKIDTVSVNFSYPYITGYGTEPAVVSSAVKAEANAVVAPIKGENGVYAIRVLEVQDSPVNEEMGARKAQDEVRGFVNRMMLRSLIEDADMVDNRSTHY